MQTIDVTEELGIEILRPDDIERPSCLTIKAERPNGICRLTVRADEIKPLMAALSKAAGALVELWRDGDDG